MTDQDQRENDARAAASEYAPHPQSSSAMYGIVAIVLLAMVVWVVSLFYGLELYPISLGVALVIALICGVLLRRLRKRRHATAYDDEYRRRSGEDDARN